MELDSKGRCCGRKPNVYKSNWSTATGPHYCCLRCSRAYDLNTKKQIPNWAWHEISRGVFECQTTK